MRLTTVAARWIGVLYIRYFNNIMVPDLDGSIQQALISLKLNPDRSRIIIIIKIHSKIILKIFYNIFFEFYFANLYGFFWSIFLIFFLSDCQHKSEELYSKNNLSEIKSCEGGDEVRDDVIIWFWKKIDHFTFINTKYLVE